MITIAELWAGQIYGTNTGKVFLEITGEDSALNGTLKLSDDRFGLSILTTQGSFKDGILSIEAKPSENQEGVAMGTVSALGRLKQNGHITGEWKSDLGTGGTFELFPHVGMREIAPSGPEQIYTATRDLGALRLFRNDVSDLIASLRQKFPQSRVVVTHIDRGAELARFSEDFERNIEHLENLKWLKLNVQTAASGLLKIVTIDLGQSYNRITTQGPDESWVLGEAEATSSFLRRRESKISTTLGKYRVNLNQVVGLIALIAMPDLPFMARLIFALSVISLLLIASKIQNSLIPNLTVNLQKSRSDSIIEIWPSIVSWIISATAGVAASALYAALQHWVKAP